MYVIKSLVQQLLEKEKNSFTDHDKLLYFLTAVGVVNIALSVLFDRPMKDYKKLNVIYINY